MVTKVKALDTYLWRKVVNELRLTSLDDGALPADPASLIKPKITTLCMNSGCSLSLLALAD